MPTPTRRCGTEPVPSRRISVRRRLLAMLLALFVAGLGALYLLVRGYAQQTADTTYDQLLRASVLSMADSLQLVQGEWQMDMPYAALALLEQARVGDGDRGPLGEDEDRLDIVLVEVGAALLLGQVEVAPGLAADPDRDAEEPMHRRVARREPERARIVGDVVELQRARIVDQDAEDSAAAREIPDLGVGLGRDTAREELLERAAAVVEYADRGKSRAREIPRGLQDRVQERIEIELGGE